jgi:ribose 5-phosphate isomerase RpiB
MKTATGCDEAAYALKKVFRPFVVAEGREVKDFDAFDGHHSYAAERACESNDGAIVTVGARGIGPEQAAFNAHAFVAAHFSDGLLAAKAERSVAYENGEA